MKASELRIGNWIDIQRLTSTPHEFIQVTGRAIGQIAALTDGECINWYPVPLTEKWMLKFGFIADYPGSSRYRKKPLEIDLKPSFGYPVRVYCGQEEWGWGHSELDTEMKYVHQLQNLYFALTGEELAIVDNL